MTTKQLALDGVITFWTATETSIDRLRAACEAIDPRLATWVPEKATPLAALRQTLETIYPGYLIRKLDVHGFAVVREDRGRDRNDYSAHSAAWFRDDGETLEFPATIDRDEERRVRESFRSNRGVLEGGRVGRFLSEVVSEYIDGTSLRQTGGVYWMPDSSREKWERIAAAVERSAVSVPSSVYVIHHEMDAAAVRAVRDAIVNEVSVEIARINDEIVNGDLGERALRNRSSEINTLLAKVQRYEGLLDVGLSELRSTLDATKNAAAAAVVLASVSAEAPANNESEATNVN